MTTRLYRFTHKAIDLVEDEDTTTTTVDKTVPSEVSLSSLTMFSTVLFMNEFDKMGFGDEVDVSETCNMSEWYRRLYSGSMSEDEDYVDVLTLPPKPIPQSGLIYATTIKNDGASSESYTSFLFVHYRPAIAKTVPSSASQELPQDVQDRIALNGVTHIWLCGSDPDMRRRQLMSKCLKRLENDVQEWKASGQGSGVLTVHTIPQAFPDMVRFLTKNGFQGGDKLVGGETGKVLYWKAL
ncbi:hypothetical protein B0O80DRAFT_500758 [Mortierella sp. GBAus27b]|nr:hypothetical protein BGX31_002187 [Mortierella sp. GBA43]KAI8350569.1 hypothetical protein B0O80DRAFT_500758 [Mortierella sp. GBAus27b]